MPKYRVYGLSHEQNVPLHVMYNMIAELEDVPISVAHQCAVQWMQAHYPNQWLMLDVARLRYRRSLSWQYHWNTVTIPPGEDRLGIPAYVIVDPTPKEIKQVVMRQAIATNADEIYDALKRVTQELTRILALIESDEGAQGQG